MSGRGEPRAGAGDAAGTRTPASPSTHEACRIRECPSITGNNPDLARPVPHLGIGTLWGMAFAIASRLGLRGQKAVHIVFPAVLTGDILQNTVLRLHRALDMDEAGRDRRYRRRVRPSAGDRRRVRATGQVIAGRCDGQALRRETPRATNGHPRRPRRREVRHQRPVIASRTALERRVVGSDDPLASNASVIGEPAEDASPGARAAMSG